MEKEGGFEAKIFIFASNQENENGENPPERIEFILPSLPALQLTSVTTFVAENEFDGSSVMVRVKVPNSEGEVASTTT